jgi:putative FmdB family regulatory protein
MPTYEYTCQKCGHVFDVYQPITASPLEICPQDQCPRKRWGRGGVRRSLSGGAGLLFKGSGFYITDYRSESYKAAAKKEAGAGSSSSAPAAPSTPPPKTAASGSGTTSAAPKSTS